jgi:hypothetical protein
MTKYYKHPKFGMVYGTAVTTPIGRLVWTQNLVTPKAPPPPKPGEAPGSPRYEVTLLIEKGPTADAFMKELKAMSDEMADLFNDKRPAKLGDFRILQDGDEMDMEKYPYYKNRWILVGRNANKVEDIVDKKKQRIEASTVLGGMKGRLVVTPLITSHGLSFKLGAVQVTEDDGTRYGGGVKDMTTLLDVIEDLPDEPTETEVAANQVLGAPTATEAVTETPKTPIGAGGKAARGKTAALDLL